MIFNLVGKGSQNPSDISDLNVTSKDIMKDKVSISKDETPIVGEAPFEYLGTEDGVDNYRVLEEEMDIILPNGDKKLLKSGNIKLDKEWVICSLPNYAYWHSVSYYDNKFIAIPYANNIISYSEDGINWSSNTLPSSSRWYSIAYDGNRFVIITGSDNTAIYSTDLINWTSTKTTLSSSKMICYGKDKFVTIRNSKSSAVSYSKDGITWTQATLPTSAQ